MRNWSRGRLDACEQLGLTKIGTAPAPTRPIHLGTPGAPAPVPRAFRGPRGEEMDFWPSVIAHAKHQLVGSPQALWDDLVSGNWRNSGSYTRRMLWPAPPPDPTDGPVSRFFNNLSPAANYIPAALSVYAATQAPSELRGESVGGATGALIGTLLGSPGGLIGTTLGTVAGDLVGRFAGRQVQDYLAPSDTEDVD